MSSFDNLFTAGAATATAPLMTLTVGALLLLVCEIFPSLARARPVLFAASILGAAWGQIAILRDPPGSVLADSYLASPTTAAWGLVFLASTFIAWAFGQRYYKTDRTFIGEHDVLMLCTPIGMSIMAGAQDFIVFFVGLELLSIPLYCLAAFRRARNDSVEAGLKYFVLGAFAVATFLYGAGLLYTATGELSLVALRALAAAGDPALSSPLALTGIALIASSLFFKVSVFPFHLWVPDVYQGSPTPVTALMATGTKAAGFAVLLNIAFLLPPAAAPLVGLIAVLTMAIGNLGALVQRDLKRLLAYSGVAHAGTLLLIVAGSLAGDPEQAEHQAALYYMAAYVFTAGGAFGLIAWLEAEGDEAPSLDSLRGLAGRRPFVAAAFALFMLSLAGIPATGGFLGKWLAFSVAVRAGLVTLSVIGVLFSVVALAYYLRVVVAMYMEPGAEGHTPLISKRVSAGLMTGVCAAMVVLLGVLPSLFLGRLF